MPVVPSPAILDRPNQFTRSRPRWHIGSQLSIQAFESFHYDHQFAAILIPTNTFAMLTTQEAQLRTLRNIYTHLVPGGKFLLDFRLTGLRDIVEHPPEIQGRWHRDEFQLLLQLAGFTEWECFATPERAPLVGGLDEMQSYWIAYKR